MARVRKIKKSMSFQQEKSMDQAIKTVSATKRPLGKPEEGTRADPQPSAATASDITSQSQDAQEHHHQLTGRKVRKKFGRKLYRGEVRSYDPETKWYWIVYEDGDEEEMDWNDLEKVLLPPEEHPKEITPIPVANKRPKKAASSKPEFIFW